MHYTLYLICLTSFACIAALDFRFQDPEPGFDRSAVKGVVAQLLRVKDPATATALEAVAGGKLHQVVVDTERTAKALLSRGQLVNRVTLIPLNKVRGHDYTQTYTPGRTACIRIGLSSLPRPDQLTVYMTGICVTNAVLRMTLQQ